MRLIVMEVNSNS